MGKHYFKKKKQKNNNTGQIYADNIAAAGKSAAS
jgi:hypothetical protein